MAEPEPVSGFAIFTVIVLGVSGFLYILPYLLIGLGVIVFVWCVGYLLYIGVPALIGGLRLVAVRWKTRRALTPAQWIDHEYRVAMQAMNDMTKQ